MATRSLWHGTTRRLAVALATAALVVPIIPAAVSAVVVDPNQLAADLYPAFHGDAGASGTFSVSLDANAGTACYSLHVALTDLAGDPVTAFDIHTSIDDSVSLALGTSTDGSGNASACVSSVSPSVINALLATPADYYVRVDTAGFSGGAAVGYLNYGYPTGPLDVHTKICPASIQTLAALTPTAKATCLDVVLPKDDMAKSVLPGYTITTYGGTATFDYHVTDGKHLDATIASARLSGGGTCDTISKTCEFAFLPYDWTAGMGPITVTPTLPAGTRLGLAEAMGSSSAVLPISMGASNAMSFDSTGESGAIVNVYLFQTPDTTPPAVGTPTVNLRTGGTLGSTAPVRLAWTASDAGSGLDHYAVQVQIDGVTKTIGTKITGKAFNTTVGSGHGYRYRVIAYDKAGNHRVSAWSPIVHLAVRQDANTAIKYSAGWTKQSLAAASGGTLKYAKVAGASAKLTFYGRSIAWVAPKGLGKGSARIYIDGALATTVSLYGTAADRLVDFSRRFSALGTHTIRVVVVGTAGHPRVDVDAFLILN